MQKIADTLSLPSLLDAEVVLAQSAFSFLNSPATVDQVPQHHHFQLSKPTCPPTIHPTMSLQLYANLVSQPSRAVAWVLKAKNVSYELVQADFGGPVFTSADFLKMNPNGFIPVLKDGDFSMFEGNAILLYLAEKFDWTDLYPKDLHTRAKINQYLHWHHTNARLLTPQVLVPLIHSKVDALTPEDEVHLKNITKLITKKTELLETFFKDQHAFIAETNEVTLADYACYCEFGQTEMLGVFDFAKYPKVSAWLEIMKKLPVHDEIHEVLKGFLASVGLLVSTAA